MTEKTTAVNYTEDQIATIVQGYLAGESVQTLAAKVGKSVKSITAKLAREGVYKAKTQVRAKAQTKAELVNILAVKLNIEFNVLQSLEKASKEALEALVSATSTSEQASTPEGQE